jgi:H+/Cl- antiporter ClcA
MIIGGIIDRGQLAAVAAVAVCLTLCLLPCGAVGTLSFIVICMLVVVAVSYVVQRMLHVPGASKQWTLLRNEEAASRRLDIGFRTASIDSN